MKTVFVVIENDIDTYCGYYIVSVWSTEELANANCNGNQEVLEIELDKLPPNRTNVTH